MILKNTRRMVISGFVAAAATASVLAVTPAIAPSKTEYLDDILTHPRTQIRQYSQASRFFPWETHLNLVASNYSTVSSHWNSSKQGSRQKEPLPDSPSCRTLTF
jgi:hypothetical protein